MNIGSKVGSKMSSFRFIVNMMAAIIKVDQSVIRVCFDLKFHITFIKTLEYTLMPQNEYAKPTKRDKNTRRHLR